MQNNQTTTSSPHIAPEADLQAQIELKHPLAIRWTHWINFPLMILMTWSGLLLYWENNNFRIGFGNFTLLPLFPASFYEALHLTSRNSEGLAWHLSFMWLFFANWLFYLGYLGISGQWKHVSPSKSSLGNAVKVVLHSLGFKKVKPAQKKYNDAQKIAYSAVAIMGVLMIVTGFALWKPDQLGWLAAPFGGVVIAKEIHFWLTIAFFVYFVIHVIQVIRAGWNNFRSMVIGVELVPSGVVAEASDTDGVLPRVEVPAGTSATEWIRVRSKRGFIYAILATVILASGWLFCLSQSRSTGVPSFLKWASEGRDKDHDGGDHPADGDSAKAAESSNLPIRKEAI